MWYFNSFFSEYENIVNKYLQKRSESSGTQNNWLIYKKKNLENLSQGKYYLILIEVSSDCLAFLFIATSTVTKDCHSYHCPSRWFRFIVSVFKYHEF